MKSKLKTTRDRTRRKSRMQDIDQKITKLETYIKLLNQEAPIKPLNFNFSVP
jgi:hypothetical protein